MQNLRLDQALVQSVRGLDDTRIVDRDSGTLDSHYYPGWFHGTVDTFPREDESPFATEYGAQALPDINTLKRMFAPDVLWPATDIAWDIWKYADFHAKATFDTASVVDYFRHPKKGYSALQQAMQPLLPSLVYTANHPEKPISLTLVNDYHHAFPSARIQWQWLPDTALHQLTVDIPEDSVLPIPQWQEQLLNHDLNAHLLLWIEDASGQRMAETQLTPDTLKLGTGGS